MEAFAPILFIVLLVINGFISWLNCRTAGMAWKDTMAVGSWFEKALLWCAAIQSTIGFSMLLLFPMGFGLIAYLTSGTPPYITPAEGKELLDQLFSLWYAMVILPCIGSGTVIWVHSVKVAIQTRRPGAIAAATWNSFAQVMNIIDLFRNFGHVTSSVGKLFESAGNSKDNKGKAAIAIIIVAVLAIIMGAIITAGLISFYARRAPSVVEEKFAAEGKVKRKLA